MFLTECFSFYLTDDTEAENCAVFDENDDEKLRRWSWLTVMISPHPFSLNLATDSLKTWGPGHRDKLKIWQLFEQQQKALLKYQHNSNWCWISGWKRKLNVWQKKLYLRAQYCESWRERGVTIWSYYMDSQAKHLVK